MGNNADPITLHKYLYANADPVNMIDPSGKFGISVALNIGAVLTTSAVTSIRAMALFGPPGSGASNWSPDLDGRIDIWEASYWWRNGNGVTQAVPLSSVDLSGVSLSEFQSKNTISVNLDFPSHFSNASDAAVYGGLRLRLVGGNNVIHPNGKDTFDFDQHKLRGGLGDQAKTVFRNLATAFAKGSLGKGRPFDINLTGQGKVGP